jgi:arogenate dehydrogenase (NADP+)
VGRRTDVCKTALAQGVVQQAGTSYTLLTGCEVIFVCTPIAAITPTVAAIAPYLDRQAIVTDVGSAKAAVVSAATAHWSRFVGGHPMAGKTEAGLAAAEAGLYVDRPYVLTPIEQTPADAIAIIADLITGLQAKLYQCSPAMHDQAVAWISHLPVMVSSSLIQACLSESDDAIAALCQALASSGFRDTSRVGGGPPELGLMMARYNRTALLHSLHAYQQQIQQVTELVQAERWNELQQHLSQTQAARPKFIV